MLRKEYCLQGVRVHDVDVETAKMKSDPNSVIESVFIIVSEEQFYLSITLRSYFFTADVVVIIFDSHRNLIIPPTNVLQ